ncbi:DUF6507 family protein [Thermobifida cellulosilytica]|jgi:hypothetical protein|uniref:ESX-1 secretion-associated protein n=1 Tax=Thermobifida cellulosilytica TB100 TaxID=665004 RepID=A0A147KES3_THECS|nr:DUF6507 family protein [Thermobifida cellulosilytica]KUP95783.1 hypothetical protein AC529_15600 [Thermobifida cellulosilytica TB100]
MSGWDLNPREISVVLQNVGNHVGGEDGKGGLVGLLETFGTHVEEAGTACESGPISMALGEFVEEYSGKLKGMVNKSISAITGCSDATMAYVNGNLEMAERAQQRVSQTPEQLPV